MEDHYFWTRTLQSKQSPTGSGKITCENLSVLLQCRNAKIMHPTKVFLFNFEMHYPMRRHYHRRGTFPRLTTKFHDNRLRSTFLWNPGSFGVHRPDWSITFWLTNPAGTLGRSDICEGFTSFWLRFYNGGIWVNIFGSIHKNQYNYSKKILHNYILY